MNIDHERILDALETQIVLVDQQGQICYVNAAWREFGWQNGMPADHNWLNDNYLHTCDQASTQGETQADAVIDGLKKVISGQQITFYFEYPCHSPQEQRWFLMRARRLLMHDTPYCLVEHVNITDRKLVEQKVAFLSMHDVLTDLGNRRHFIETYRHLWLTHQRHNWPLSIMMIDIDHFKRFNDENGHLAGDSCLAEVANALKCCARRPDDHVFRYGGEEFIVLLGETNGQDACKVAENMRQRVQDTTCKHQDGTAVTISIGIASDIPSPAGNQDELVARADKMLYQSKNLGRNRISTEMNQNDPALASAETARIADSPGK